MAGFQGRGRAHLSRTGFAATLLSLRMACLENDYWLMPTIMRDLSKVNTIMNSLGMRHITKAMQDFSINRSIRHNLGFYKSIQGLAGLESRV